MYLNFFNVRKAALSLIFFWIFLSSNAQTTAIDSLTAALQKATDDESILSIKVQLAWEYYDVENQKSLKYSEEAYGLAIALGDTAKMVRSGRLMGQLLRKAERMDEALKILTKLSPIAKRNGLKDDYKKILNAIANAYALKADYDKALDYNFQSLIVREADGDKAEISVTLNNIGFVYFKLRNYELAAEYYKRSLSLKRESNDTYDLDRLLINLGLCYNQMKGDESKFLRAQDHINEALRVCGDKCSDYIRIEANFGLGTSFFGQKKWKESDKHFQESLSIARKLKDNRWQAENLVYIGKIYTELEDFDRAKSSLFEALGFAKGSGYNQLLMDIYKQSSKLFNQLEDFENAAHYQQQYIQLKDSLISEELVKNIARIQTNFEERENIATIAANQKVIKQQRDLSILSAVVAILAGLLILVLQRSNRTIKRVNAQLSEAKEVIQEQNQLLENKNKYLDKEVETKTEDLERANQSLKQVNDELDNFIYKTSHDIRGPLASLKGMCNVALMDVNDPTALDYLKKLDSTAERLNTILTRLLIINQINNSKLSVSKIDFTSIVHDVMLLEKKKGLPQKLSFKKNIDEFASIQSDKELVRIVLENLIDNAIKFYNDSERVDSFVEVAVQSCEGNQVKVRVIDNGIGISESNPGKLFRMFFRASERSETGGIGLYIVKTATAKLGGKVGLLTTPEGFTEFYVVFPQVPPSPDDGHEKPSIY